MSPICFCSAGCATSEGAREHDLPWHGLPPCPCWCHWAPTPSGRRHPAILRQAAGGEERVPAPSTEVKR
jgi:hypothetical protein